MGLPPYAAAIAILLAADGACAQSDPGQTPPQEPARPSRVGEIGRKAGEIATQPVRDIGVSKAEIPQVLVQATDDPYSLQGLRTCRQLAAAVTELNGVLGPDFEPGPDPKENRGAKLAEAGGKTVVNSLIPFRSLVREISGAAPAQRSLNAAIDAGYARRGFLRGVHRRQGCRTPF
jgi:hypothetical protein